MDQCLSPSELQVPKTALEPSPRALVLDRRPVIGTEICRSMARRGFAVDLFGERGSPAFHSRYCARRFFAPPLAASTEFRHALCEVVCQARYDAIFVCNEEILDELLSFPDCGLLPGLPLSSPGSLRLTLSKAAMTKIASDAGVSVPRTVVPDGPDELDAIIKDLGLPVVVKGDRGESGERVRIAHSAGQAIAAFQEISALERAYGCRPSIQEHVSGVAYSVGGLFHHGNPLRVCAHRKLLTIPPQGGLTVSGVTDDCPLLLEQAFKIFAAIGYTGLGHVEFIRDSDGQFNFIELNPRVWGTLGVGEYAGVDFFTPYIELARGDQPQPDLSFQPGVRFHRIGREGKMIFAKPSRLFGFVRDCLDPRVYSDFRWSDPMPHLVSLATHGLGL